MRKRLLVEHILVLVDFHTRALVAVIFADCHIHVIPVVTSFSAGETVILVRATVETVTEQVAVKVSESPSARLMEVLLIDTPLTAMVLSPFSGSQLVSIAEDKRLQQLPRQL